MRDLKPCPFCGSEYAQVRYMGGKWQEPSAFDSGYRGECCDCGAMTAAYDTESGAIAAWNSRMERTCRITASATEGLTSIEPKKWFELSCGHTFKLYGLGKPTACPVCGKAVKR